MAKQFHNLAGWLRDIKAARDADSDLWAAFVDYLEQALDEIEGPGGAEDELIGDSNAEDDVDGALAEPRQQSLPGAGRPDAGSAARGAPASRLDAILDRLAGQERAQAQQELDALRRDAVAGTLPGAKRMVSMPEAAT